MDSWTFPVFALKGFRTAYDCFCQKRSVIALIRSIQAGLTYSSLVIISVLSAHLFRGRGSYL